MTDFAPLTDDEYHEYMDRLKEGNTQTSSDAVRIVHLKNRHLSTLTGEQMDRTAVHEAGHIVVSKVLGYDTEYAILKDDGTGEANRIVPEVAGADDAVVAREIFTQLADYATVKVAGYVAEEIGWGRAREPEGDLVGMVSYRFHQALSFISALESADRASLIPESRAKDLISMGVAFVDQGESRAEQILRANWDVTRSLADALLATRRLAGEELTILLADVRVSDGRDSGQ